MQVVHLLGECQSACLSHRYNGPERVPKVIAVLSAQPELGLERTALSGTVQSHRADRVIARTESRHGHIRLDQVDAFQVGEIVIARLDVIDARQRVHVLAVDREHLQVTALGPRLLATVLNAPCLTETERKLEIDKINFVEYL